MSRRPTIPVGLSSGQEGWLTVDLDAIRFILEVENGRRTEETLNLADLKKRLPSLSNIVAEVVAEAIRTDRKLAP
jgi:hypothetical protein